MVKALGIIIGRRRKWRPRKIENQTIEKIGCVPIFYFLILKYRDSEGLRGKFVPIIICYKN